MDFITQGHVHKFIRCILKIDPLLEIKTRDSKATISHIRSIIRYQNKILDTKRPKNTMSFRLRAVVIFFSCIFINILTFATLFKGDKSHYNFKSFLSRLTEVQF